MKTFNQFLLENVEKYKTTFFSSIYDSVHNKPNGINKMSEEQARSISKKIYDDFDIVEFKNWFNGSVVKNINSFSILNGGDNSPKLVFHSSGENFDKFKTPAFFGDGGPNAYDGDFYYYCVLQMKNPLEMRRSVLGEEKWMKLVSEMLKDISNFDNVMDFAKRYGDGYGFFKLLESQFGDPYRWDLVYKYINDNNYDGMIYRESDQSIQWYFNGYLIMKSEQVKIIYKCDDEIYTPDGDENDEYDEYDE